MRWPPRREKRRRRFQTSQVPPPRSKYLRFALDKGNHNEMLVYRALMSTVNKPDWFESCRRADLDEDNDGIDLVVSTTDVGELYIQVKSSAYGAKAFNLEESVFKPDRPLIVMVPKPDEDAMDLQKRIFKELGRLHHEQLAKAEKLANTSPAGS